MTRCRQAARDWLLSSCLVVLASCSTSQAGELEVKRNFYDSRDLSIERDDFGSDDRLVIRDRRRKIIGTIERDQFGSKDRLIVKGRRGKKIGEINKRRY